MIKYKITKEIYETFSKALQLDTQFGYVDDSLENYYIERSHIDNLLIRGYNLNAVSIPTYGVGFEEFIAPFEMSKFKIYKYLPKNSGVLDEFAVPYDIDFKTALSTSFQKKTLPKIQGKPTAVEYYEKKSFDTNANGTPKTDVLGNPIIKYENLICRIDFTLQYDAFGFLIHSSEKLRWYKENGALAPEYKDLGRGVLDPVLDHETRIEEGKIRRSAIVNGLQITVLGMIKMIYPTKTALEVLLIGREFLSRFELEFQGFISSSASITDPASPNVGKKIIVLAIQAAQDPWLDIKPTGATKTVRQYCVGELSI